jgi:hypothetical protein
MLQLTPEMRPILFFLLLISYSTLAFAQDNSIPSPNTETAFLNYDFRLQRSGYEKVEAKMIYSYVNQPLNLYFQLDSTYDYMFVAICDSSTGGIKVSCTFENDPAPYFESDATELLTEFNSKITLIPINVNNLTGLITVRLELLGKIEPKEPSYYLFVRKKRIY